MEESLSPAGPTFRQTHWPSSIGRGAVWPVLQAPAGAGDGTATTTFVTRYAGSCGDFRPSRTGTRTARRGYCSCNTEPSVQHKRDGLCAGFQKVSTSHTGKYGRGALICCAGVQKVAISAQRPRAHSASSTVACSFRRCSPLGPQHGSKCSLGGTKCRIIVAFEILYVILEYGTHRKRNEIATARGNHKV